MKKKSALVIKWVLSHKAQRRKSGCGLCCNVAANVNLHTCLGGLICNFEEPCGNFFVYVFLTAGLTDTCRHFLNNHRCPVLFQRDCHLAWSSFSISTDDAFHCFLLFKSSYHSKGLGLYVVIIAL